MSSVEPEGEVTQEMDDSGCVQDESSPKKPSVCPDSNGYVGQAELLDLSDDVLLYILRYCEPHDLKALGFSCARLGALVLERSLWTRVDARSVCTGRMRLRWLLHALHAGTRELKVAGYARQARGCRGHVKHARTEFDEDYKHESNLNHMSYIEPTSCEHASEGVADAGENVSRPPYPLFRQHARLNISAAHTLPRQASSPSWPEDCEHEDPEPDCGVAPGNRVAPADGVAQCPGPTFTLTAKMLKELQIKCPRLTTLYLEYCNINCHKINFSNFPPTVRRLSVRGSRCYNPPLEKSYLFRIHDYLPALEYLDLSECAWLSPAALLPLSKLASLRTLLMRECPAMAEFVAYVSLAARYGFRALQVLDLRGTPVGDSEVSALGWLPALEELHLAAPGAPAPAPRPHTHHPEDPPPREPAHSWEMMVPEYYRRDSETESPESSIEDVEGQVEIVRRRLASRQPADGISLLVPSEQQDRPTDNQSATKRKPDDKPTTEDEAGPSKRAKDDSFHDNKGEKKTQDKKDDEDNDDDDKDGNRIAIAADNVNANDNNTELEYDDFIIQEIRDETACNSSSSENDSSSDSSLNRNSRDNFAGSSNRTKKTKAVNNFNDYPSELFISNFIEESSNTECNKTEEEPNSSRNSDNDRSNNNNTNEHSEAAENVEDNETNKTKNKYINIGTLSMGTPAQDEDNPRQEVTDEDPKPGTSRDNDSKTSNHTRKSKDSRSKRSVKYKISLTDTADNIQPDQPTDDKDQNDQKSDDKKTYKYKINVEDGASSSRYSIKVKVKNEVFNRDGEPSPKRRKTSEGSSDNGEENKVEGNGEAAEESSPDREEREPRNPPAYVRFRRNQDPVIIPYPMAHRQEQEQASPRHHVLYVNLGQQLHAVYRLLPNRPFQSTHNQYHAHHLRPELLLTDMAIRRFGRSDTENINVVNIGPNGPQFGGQPHNTERPDRSPLRVLTATGYRDITNNSLIHLATAAPHLRMIDFSSTRVTAEGVESFKALRPEVEVKFSEFKSQSNEE